MNNKARFILTKVINDNQFLIMLPRPSIDLDYSDEDIKKHR
jgi:hypothetical protein